MTKSIVSLGARPLPTERKLAGATCCSDRAEVCILHATAHRIARFVETRLKVQGQLIGNQKLRFETAAPNPGQAVALS